MVTAFKDVNGLTKSILILSTIIIIVGQMISNIVKCFPDDHNPCHCQMALLAYPECIKNIPGKTDVVTCICICSVTEQRLHPNVPHFDAICDLKCMVTWSDVKRSCSCILITLAHLIGTEELAGYGFFCDGLFPTLTFRTLTKKL